MGQVSKILDLQIVLQTAIGSDCKFYDVLLFSKMIIIRGKTFHLQEFI